MEEINLIIFATAIGATAGLRMTMPLLALSLASNTPLYSFPVRLEWMADPFPVAVLIIVALTETWFLGPSSASPQLNVVALVVTPFIAALTITDFLTGISFDMALLAAGVPAFTVRLLSYNARRTNGLGNAMNSVLEFALAFGAGILATFVPWLSLAGVVVLSVARQPFQGGLRFRRR